jgi:predicted DsbA family dithiol-disulfide isomerase
MNPTAPPAPGTVVVWGDIACPWASLAVHRLHRHRRRLGLEDRVRIDHRAFALELVNERSTPRPVIDAEVAAIGAHEPGLGWQPWQRRLDEYPSTALLALAAVQAAKSEAVGGLLASEQLDLRLRRAFYAESRPISLWSEVLAAAADCDAVDADALVEVMRSGTGLAAVLDQAEAAGRDDRIKGSPHLFTPDGADQHNPGLQVHWTKGQGKGFPVIEKDEPEVYDELVRAAAGP